MVFAIPLSVLLAIAVIAGIVRSEKHGLRSGLLIGLLTFLGGVALMAILLVGWLAFYFMTGGH